jgi:hypothetical protein
MDGGGWQEWFTFSGDLGCAGTLIGFILFVIALTVLSRILF